MGDQVQIFGKEVTGRITPILVDDEGKTFTSGIFVNKYLDSFHGVTVLVSPGGNPTLDSVVVSDGALWIVKAIDWFAPANTITHSSIAVYNAAGTQLVLGYFMPTPTLTHGCWNGELVMYPGDYLRAQYYGSTAGNNLYLVYKGYRVEL